MSHSPSPPPGQETPDSEALDQAWWDRLAGRGAGAPDEPDLQRADQLRAALLRLDQDMQAQQAQQASGQADPVPPQGQGLQFEPKARARSVGASPKPAWASWRIWGSVAVAASLLMVLVLQDHKQDETLDDGFTVRGDAPVQTLTDPQPLARAQDLARQLRSHDLVVRVHSGKAIAILEIEVPPEDFAALKPALEAAGIRPRPGQLLVRIQQP